MKWVVRLTTVRGVFWWNGERIYDRQAMAVSGDAFRAWGWLDGLDLAQRFATRGNAVKAAQRLFAELGRLYPVRIDVVGAVGSMLGWRVDETEVTPVGDCRGDRREGEGVSG